MRELNRDGEWEESDYPRRPKPTKTADELFAIARYQKVILFCVLIHIIVGVGASTVARPFINEMPLVGGIAAGIFVLVMITTEVVFMFLLATKVFGVGPGIAFAIFTVVPCVGLIMLLIINGKATSILKEHDIRVGLLGARSSDLEEFRMDEEGRTKISARRNARSEDD